MLPSFISTFWSYVCFLHLFLFMAGPPSKLWAITSVAFITHARTCTDRYGWTRAEGAWESAAHARVRPFASFAWLQANSLSGLLVLFFFVIYDRPITPPWKLRVVLWGNFIFFLARHTYTNTWTLACRYAWAHMRVCDGECFLRKATFTPTGELFQQTQAFPRGYPGCKLLGNVSHLGTFPVTSLNSWTNLPQVIVTLTRPLLSKFWVHPRVVVGFASTYSECRPLSVSPLRHRWHHN